MAQVSATQLATWSAAAGLAGQDQAVSVAIALAAGGDPAAPQGAWGIGGGGDGQAQAVEAANRFKASGWATFPTHQTGHFQFYMPTALAVIQPVPKGQTAIGALIQGAELISPGLRNLDNTARGVGETVQGAAADATNSIAAPFLVPIHFLEDPTTWVRVAKILIGASLIVIAGAKFGLDNIFGAPARMLGLSGEEVGQRAGEVGLLFLGRGAGAKAGNTIVHNHAARAARPPRQAPVPRRTAARKAAPPKPESDRVRQAKEILRQVDQEKRAKRAEE